jgi:acetyl-CoA synthetase
LFFGFSATAVASRINDSECKMVITSDGGYRGNKTIELKSIIDEALDKSVNKVLVVEKNTEYNCMKEEEIYGYSHY